MSININKYFEASKASKMDVFQMSYGTTTETSVSVFNNDVENQQIGVASDISGKALYQGKIGSFSTDAIDAKTPEIMMQAILESAKYGKEDKIDNFYKGGKKYRKAKICFADFKPSSLKDLRAFALDISAIAQKKDKRISKVQVDVSMITSQSLKANTLGLKAKESSKLYAGYVSIVAENEKGEPRSGSWSFKSFHNLEELKTNALKAIDHASKDALDFFGSVACKGKTYKAVLSPDSVSSLFSFYVGQLSAKNVQKHLSIFEGKLNQLIASKSLTVLHTPHVSSASSTSYDSEGVPTCDFPVIKRGVLTNYFYSLETANEEHIECNGCGCGNGNAAPITLTIKPGRFTQDELFAKVNNGIYINNISGLNSGINDTTLDFSLPCQGYLIENGKLSTPVSMIICAGNLKDVFADITAVGNDTYNGGGIISSSVIVKKLAVSGK